MAALTCEICGGSLTGKPGGIFECDFCGTKYDTAWAKEKVQEIKGTVKVEGTVEVQGTVKIDASGNVEALLRRGFIMLEDRDWEAAENHFEGILNTNPDCGDAYVGCMMASAEIHSRSEFKSRLLLHAFDTSKELPRALDSTGSATFEDEMGSYRTLLKDEEQRQKNNRENGNARIEEYRALRDQYAPVRQMIAPTAGYMVCADGTTIRPGFSENDSIINADEWHDMVGIAHHWNNSSPNERRRGIGSVETLIGLRADGAVLEFTRGDYSGTRNYCTVQFGPEEDISQILCGSRYHKLFCLRKNGTVTANDFLEKDIVWIGDRYGGAYAITRDGALYKFGDLDGPIRIETNTRVMECVRWLGDVFLHENGTVSFADKRNGTSTASGIAGNWADIIQLATTSKWLAGLKADGTVEIVAGNVNYEEDAKETETILKSVKNWKNIIAIFGVSYVLYGVTKDGFVFKSKEDEPIARLFNDLDSLKEQQAQMREKYILEAERKAKEQAEKERLEAERKAKERAERIAALEDEKSALTTKLPKIKGLFADKRRKEIEERLASIETELQGL